MILWPNTKDKKSHKEKWRIKKEKRWTDSLMKIGKKSFYVQANISILKLGWSRLQAKWLEVFFTTFIVIILNRESTHIQ